MKKRLHDFRRPAVAAMLALAALAPMGPMEAAGTTGAAASAVSTSKPAAKTVTAKAAPQAAREKAKAKTQAAKPVSQRTLTGRPSFPAELPAPVKQKVIGEVSFHLAPAYTKPMQPAAPRNTAILGKAEATEGQMVAFILAHNPQPKLTCTVLEIVHAYYTEGEREGIRGDIALAQALKETGFFAYGGDVAPTQNNFCGLGATGNHEKGASFATAALGVRAHIQHLKAYASTEMPKGTLTDPRYLTLKKYRPDVFGKVTTWTGLNGVWAVPGTRYGEDILRLWKGAMAPTGSDSSLEFAEKKIAAAPKASESYLYRGAVYYARQDYEDALADFQQAEKLGGNRPEALYDLALTKTALGKTKDARKDYARMIKDDAAIAEAYYNAGLLALDSRDYGGAKKDFEKVLSLVPQHADAQNAIAVTEIRQKKYKEAWASLAKAAALNSANWNVIGNQFVFSACLEEKGTTTEKGRKH